MSSCTTTDHPRRKRMTAHLHRAGQQTHAVRRHCLVRALDVPHQHSQQLQQKHGKRKSLWPSQKASSLPRPGFGWTAPALPAAARTPRHGCERVQLSSKCLFHILVLQRQICRGSVGHHTHIWQQVRFGARTQIGSSSAVHIYHAELGS